MGLFGKNKEVSYDSSRLSGILSEDCAFEGTLIFEGLLRIDGHLTGKIICRPNCSATLIIGKTGHVDVDLLIVDDLIVAGQLFGKGPIIALNKADLHGKSRVEVQKNSSLYCSNLSVKGQALFQGKSAMIRHESDETKSKIKKLIFDNKKELINEPFKVNPILKKISNR
ncbi:MAG: polymer-forming cytoskeletal protein [SAR324 cluster bacterium]|nr:polymer-forming cytoskeletal protein [SAR324 cluster bacterium]